MIAKPEKIAGRIICEIDRQIGPLTKAEGIQTLEIVADEVRRYIENIRRQMPLRIVTNDDA